MTVLAGGRQPTGQGIEAYRTAAIAGARRAVADLARLQVEVLVTGSLTGPDFGLHSDVDFLVTQCPREMQYALEGIVEDALGDIPFDVFYWDEVEPRKLSSITDTARRVDELV